VPKALFFVVLMRVGRGGHVGFWFWARKRWSFFFLLSKERGKCAGEGNHLTEMNPTSLVLHIN
jgi:hypothetical protein